eukprot:Skav213375  [mRNA]  locus=scaffold797:96267:109169:+ [translate_table: standard]
MPRHAADYVDVRPDDDLQSSVAPSSSMRYPHSHVTCDSASAASTTPEPEYWVELPKQKLAPFEEGSELRTLEAQWVAKEDWRRRAQTRYWAFHTFGDLTIARVWVESSFWNFDALFQPQQHPARDAHDTFFMEAHGAPSRAQKIPEDYLERVKEMHEKGGQGSIGWRYDWSEDEARKTLLRTHTTAVSAGDLGDRGESDIRLLPMGLPEDVTVIAWGIGSGEFNSGQELFSFQQDVAATKKNPMCWLRRAEAAACNLSGCACEDTQSGLKA